MVVEVVAGAPPRVTSKATLLNLTGGGGGGGATGGFAVGTPAVKEEEEEVNVEVEVWVTTALLRLAVVERVA